MDGVLVQGWLYRDQLKPVAELDGSGQVVARFVYGSNPLVPDYIVKGGATYRILTDHLGSPRLVVDTEAGLVVQRRDHDAWGRVTLDTNPGVQPFGFAGGLEDPDTELVRFGARDYDPRAGRWSVKDPILFRGEDGNLYSYVDSSPVEFLDPLGLWGVSGQFYWGLGGNFTIGYSEGRPFLRVGLGVGVGAGLSFSPFAGLPGTEASRAAAACSPVTFFGASASAGVLVGPVAVGASWEGGALFYESEKKLRADYVEQSSIGVDYALSGGDDGPKFNAGKKQIGIGAGIIFNIVDVGGTL